MKRTPSIDHIDCQSIGQSLKRVKISTSPGELRLDRDFESLISGKHWVSSSSSVLGSSGVPPPGIIPSPLTFGDRPLRIHGEIHCSNAKLIRDPVNPLRMRLIYLHRPSSSSHQLPQPSTMSSSSTLERWTFLILVPRMYPHAPPVITRVSRDVIPNNENVAYNSLNSNSYNNHFHNNNNFSNNVNMHTSMGGIPDGAMVNSSYIQNCWSNEGAMARTSAAMVASSVMQSQVEPPVPEQVWIQSLPPMRSTCDGSSLSSSSSSGAVPQSRGEDSFEFGSGIGLNNNVCETSAGVGFGSEGVEGHNMLEIDAATSIYNAWSPISSLGDLLDFLIGIPARRREWWSSGHNRQRHQQQLRFLRTGNGGVEGGGPLSTSVRLVPTASNASNTVQNVWSEPNNAMSSSPQHLLRHHCHTKQPPFPSSSCDMDHDGEDDNLMMMDDCKHDCDGMISSPKKRVNPLATNRFDVGYDRGAMIHRWGVRY